MKFNKYLLILSSSLLFSTTVFASPADKKEPEKISVNCSDQSTECGKKPTPPTFDWEIEGGDNGGENPGETGPDLGSGPGVGTSRGDKDKNKEPKSCNDVETGYHICRAKASENYLTKLRSECRSKGSGTVGADGVVINASYTYDEYTMCKDDLLGLKENEERVCEVIRSARKKTCK